MLVLSRQVGESITATLVDGQTIIIHVARIHGRTVTLGITAPTEVELWRSEIDAARKRGTIRRETKKLFEVANHSPTRPEDPNDPEDLNLML